MKVRSVTFLLLSLLFISSEGKWTRQKLTGKGTYRPVNNEEQEFAAFCPGCSGTNSFEVNPLKWVTYEEWEAMPGGRENNPAVRHKGAPNSIRPTPDRDYCVHFGQVYIDGCWQTGCVSTDGKDIRALMAAWNRGYYYNKTNPSGNRYLVNPGNSVRYTIKIYLIDR